MAGKVRKIRKVERSHVADFDDQLWSINVAILILAGFVAGTVIGKSDFSEARLLYNGWVHMISVLVWTGVAILAVLWLQGKVRRRILLCVVLSLLAHVVLVTRMYEGYLVYLARLETEQEQQVVEEHELVVVPDYDWRQIEQPQARQSFQEPLETEAPKPADPEAIKRRADEPDLPVEMKPVEEPEVPQRQQPNPTITRREDLSAPRRAEQAGGLSVSRQPWKAQSLPEELIPDPQIRPPTRQAAVPRSDIAPRQRETSEVRIDQRQAFEELPSSRRQPERTEIARAANRREPIPDRPTTPAPSRRVSPAAEIPRATTPAEQPVRMAQATPRAEPPRSPDRSNARRRANAPQITRQTAESVPTPAAPRTVAPAATQQRTAQQTPRLAQAPRAVPSRPPSRVVLPSDAPRPQPQDVAVSTSGGQSTLDPSRLQIPRRAERASSPSRVDIAQRTAESAVRPATGSTLPAMIQMEQLPATMAARRRTTSQQQPSGSDTAPARPSSLAPRTSSGVALPATTIAAEAAPAATPAPSGGELASRVPNVGSTAVVRSAGARPPVGNRIAAAGAAEYAVGSSQVVSRAGRPRAMGMDQASAAVTGASPQIARGTGPAAVTAASGMPQPASIAEGTAASQARAPSVPSFNLQSSTARRGGTPQPLASQDAVGAGPTGSSGTSGAVSIAAASRVTRHESIARAISGGGTPKPGRTVGGAASPSATAEASSVAVAAPSGRSATDAVAMLAQTGGPRRQSSGMPGRRQSQPMAGALEAMTSEGEPLSAAVARRAAAAETEPGGRDIAAGQSVTVSRSDVGIDLPTASVPVENAPTQGAGGITVARGGLPSSLAQGSSASVRRAATNLMPGQTTSVAGPAETGLGSAMTVAMAGQTRASGDDLPTLDGRGPQTRIRRTAAGGPALAVSGQIAAEPVRDTSSGSPAGQPGGAVQPSALAAPTGAVAQNAGSGSLAAQPAEETGTLAGPAGGAVAAAHSSRAARDDSTVPADAPGAVAGPQRTMGVVGLADLSGEAPTMAEAGPTTISGDTAADAPMPAGVAGSPRRAAGLSGDFVDRTAVETAMETGPAAATPGTVAGPRRTAPGDLPGRSMAAEMGRAPTRSTDVPGLPLAMAETIQPQPIAAAAPAGSGDAGHLPQGTDVGPPSRQGAGLTVQIAAAAGPGGLSHDPSLVVGIDSRRARRESETIHPVPRRFVVPSSGGHLAIDGRVSEEPAEAFRQRDPGRRADIAQASGGSEGTELAVEMGLDFFARTQFPDGHWSLHKLPEGAGFEDDEGLGTMSADTAATGLALLSYLGAGYTHTGDKHRGVVRRGVDWLVRNQKDNGDLYTGGSDATWFYSHGIAAIALCEAYGMTRDPDLREPARKAIDFLVKTQDPKQGGWRYYLNESGVSWETDTSVTGWQLMALKSAQMAGLDVPEATLGKIGDWLEIAGAPSEPGRYVYNPNAKGTPQQQLGRDPSLAMTAEAMLMQMYLGEASDDPQLLAGADYLQDNLPAVGTTGKSLRDCYYWYYATQAMFHLQDEHWTAWNERLRPLLRGSQEQSGPTAGSWHPKRPVPDRWGHAGGRHYVTAMHVLMLEVYYRHLPLFDELRR